MAKNIGCKTIAIAGADEKCSYLKNFLKADHTINYKKENVKETLKKVAPEGIDLYFDNVGGKMLDDILTLINDYSRIVMCGAIS